MISLYNVIRRPSFRFLIVFASFLVVSLHTGFAMPESAPSYNDIQIDEVAAPGNFENAIRYQITYFNKADGSSYQVFPSLEERQRDADLILAQLVSRFLNEQYEAQGKSMDENVVDAANIGQILDLVGKDYLSKSWSADRLNNLRQFLHKNEKNLLLFTLNVYLDYPIPGGYYSGNDINPIILNFKTDEKSADEATFIVVNCTDK